MIGRAVCDERGLQRRLLPQVECEQKIDFHKERVSGFKFQVSSSRRMISNLELET
jgi:hypothetical protein